MAVTDKLKRWGDRNKSFLVGPVTLVGPITDARRKGFASATRIDGAVDVYEITDGIGATEGAYTITIRPYSERGLTAKHRAVGRVALVRQVNGVGNPGAPSTVVGIRSPRDSRSTVTLGPAFILNQDRVFVVIERQDTSTLRYILEVDRIPTLWGLAGSNPSLDLRFAENKSLTDAVSGQNLITFTRATTGTFVNSQGQIETAAIDAPRFDHNPTTGESLGLLVEEQRVNLLVRSEEFDNASWSKGGLLAFGSGSTANAITAPTGTVTADLLTEDTSTGQHRVWQTASNTVNTNAHTVSFYAKAKERTRIYVGINESPSFSRQGNATFNLGNGTVISFATGNNGATGGTASIVDAGNGWYRCSYSLVLGGTDTKVFTDINITSTGSTISYTGDGTSGIYIWGAQLEAGAFPTSYIPTAGTAVTRAADVASISGSNFSSWMTSFNESTFFVEYTRPPVLAGQGFLFEGHEGSTLRGLSTSLESVQVPRVTVRHGASRHDIIQTMAAYLTGSNRLAARTSASGSASASNGIIYTGGSPTQSDWSAGSQISIGRRGAFNTNYINTTILRLTYWPQSLGNEVLQRITQ